MRQSTLIYFDVVLFLRKGCFFCKNATELRILSCISDQIHYDDNLNANYIMRTSIFSFTIWPYV